MFLTSTDFIGYYKISGNSHTAGELVSYIDDNEPLYLRALLGNTLYDLFIADLDANNIPQSARFTAIFNAFYIDETIGSGCQYNSLGIKEMLKGFVYYHYVSDSDFFNTISGNVKNNFSNSTKAKGIEFGLNERWNMALQSYNAIQWYICENSATYPEYNGQPKDVLTWL